jgi:hypothetical protein
LIHDHQCDAVLLKIGQYHARTLLVVGERPVVEPRLGSVECDRVVLALPDIESDEHVDLVVEMLSSWWKTPSARCGRVAPSTSASRSHHLPMDTHGRLVSPLRLVRKTGAGAETDQRPQ